MSYYIHYLGHQLTINRIGKCKLSRNSAQKLKPVVSGEPKMQPYSKRDFAPMLIEDGYSVTSERLWQIKRVSLSNKQYIISSNDFVTSPK